MRPEKSPASAWIWMASSINPRSLAREAAYFVSPARARISTPGSTISSGRTFRFSSKMGYPLVEGHLRKIFIQIKICRGDLKVRLWDVRAVLKNLFGIEFEPNLVLADYPFSPWRNDFRRLPNKLSSSYNLIESLQLARGNPPSRLNLGSTLPSNVDKKKSNISPIFVSSLTSKISFL